MKKIAFLLLSLFITFAVSAQTQTQQGISYRYNGKNPRTPLPNVTVECATANNAVISDSVGRFALTFNKLKMGDRMGLVTVRKREMMIFNQQAVDEWSIRKEPLCLILCDANEFENQKQELINIGKQEAKKKYDRQKAELEQQLKASIIDRTKYEVELDKAWEELDRLHKHIDEYADLFARIDQSEIDTLAQQAMDLFNKGLVNEAVRLFEQGNYLEKLKADNRTIQQAENMIETAEQVKSKAKEDMEMHLHSLKAQVEAYKVQNEWQKAGALLKGLADELDTFEALLEYANFCGRQKHYEEAELYCDKANAILMSILDQKNDDFYLKKCRLSFCYAGIFEENRLYKESENAYLSTIETYELLSQRNPASFELDEAKTLTHLAYLYITMNQFDNCEKKCLEALKICEEYTDTVSEKYEYTLATISYTLGILYHKTQRLQESESRFLSSIEKYKHLAATNPVSYEADLIKPLFNLASLYITMDQFDKSETFCVSALEVNEKLAKKNPEAHVASLARIKFLLAQIYMHTQRYKESEELYLSVLQTFEKLASDNPLVYTIDIAAAKHNLANIYDRTQRLNESETMVLSALEIFEKYAESDFLTYGKNVADLKINHAILCHKLMKLEESEREFLSGLDIILRLSQTNPSVYTPDLLNTYFNLGVFYSQLFQFEKSEPMYLSSLELAEKLVDDNPSAFLPILAKVRSALGELYCYMKRFEESETVLLSALSTYKDLAKNNPDVHLPALASCYVNIGNFYYYTQDYEKGIGMYSSGLEIYESFSEKNPLVFEGYVAMTQYCIGLLKLAQNKYSEGVEILEKSTTNYKRLLPKNPSLKKDYYGATHWLAHLYAGTKDYSSAYNALEEWLIWAKESKWEVPEFNSEEFYNISKYSIYDGKFSKAEQWAMEGLSVDSTQNKINSVLAATLLFQGKYDEAETIYRQYKNELKDNFLQDFNDFEAAGVIPEERKKEVERIKLLLME